MSTTTTTTTAASAQWVGASIAVGGALTMTDWMAIIGVAIAFFGAAGGLCINFWRSRRMVEIEQARLDREFPIDEE